MGRPRTRRLVESYQPLTLRDLVPRHVRAAPERYTLILTVADGPSLTFSATRLLGAYEQRPFLGGPRAVRIPLLQCPACGARRRVLFVVGARLGCRGCFNLAYQSKCETWDWPLAEALNERGKTLAREPGPKGARYRAWARRALRIRRLQDQWLARWSRRVLREFPSRRP